MFNGATFTDIATVVAAVVALSLTLAGAIGKNIMFVTEALKTAFNVKPGYGGLVAIVTAMVLCGLVGVVTAAMVLDTPSTGKYVLYGLVGLVVGIFVGSGAIENHKASAAVNTENSSAIQALKTIDNVPESVNQMAPMAMNWRSEYAPAAYMESADLIPKRIFTGNGEADSDDVETGDDISDDVTTDHDDLDTIIQAGPQPGEKNCDCTPETTAVEPDAKG